jgi:NAD(P)-dependent dehydrogenase (short-subunit alcohol dehydrogenase family)
MAKDFDVFSGGVAVITGAGSGIGSGLARRAAELGMTVVVADISGPRADAVAAEIRAKGGDAEAVVVDVAQPEELDRLAALVAERFGDVRLLINNAGIETIGYAWEIPAARWEATLNINIHGVVHGVRAFVPYMLKSGQEAWIGNLSSIGGLSVMPTQTAYIMTKHAVQAFSECLYLEMELAKAPIHVSAIIPGMIKTSIFDAAAGAGEPQAASAHRKVMHDTMQAYGMDLAEGCEIFLEKMAAGEFWVSSQPDMTEQVNAGRIEFLRTQALPSIPAEARALLGL